jgi:peptide/nickel transport system substrate-binding protein
VITAVLLAGCASTGPDAAGDPVDGGTITLAIDQDPGSQLDIHVTGTDIAALVLRNVFDSLVVQDSDGSIKPWLATEWEISEDGTEYTFTLREGVTFHDGEKFDAAAVKANFDHVIAPETKSQYGAALLGGDAYQGTEVIDENTVKVTLNRPFAPFLQGLSTTYLGFYSPKVLEESADKLVAGGKGITVGTGPYVFEDYVDGQEIVLTKNADYDWAPDNATHEGPARPDELRFTILPDNAVRAGVVGSGDADLAGNVSPNDVPTLEADSSIVLNATEAPGLPWSIFLNHSRGVLADQNVRLAFQRGIDIDSAVEAVYGGEYDRAWSVLGPTTPNAYDSSLEGTWEYDAALANELLDTAGWTEKDAEGYRVKDGQRLSAKWLTTSAPREDRKSLADAFQADLKKIGFELIPDPKDSGAYIDDLMGGSYDIIDWSFIRPEGDILRLHLYSEFAPIQNASYVSDPQVDEWVTAAAASTDADEREELYSKVQKWAVDDAAIVPVYVPRYITASSAQIGGLRFDINGWPLLYDAWTAKG